MAELIMKDIKGIEAGSMNGRKLELMKYSHRQAKSKTPVYFWKIDDKNFRLQTERKIVVIIELN